MCVHVCAWNPGAVQSLIGNNVAPLLASLIKGIFWLLFRAPVTAAAIALHAATCEPPVHRGYLDGGETGTPAQARYAIAKAIPGGSDEGDCASAWAAVEVLVSEALGTSLPPL